MRPKALLLVFALISPLVPAVGQDAASPRQVYQRAEALFAQGHTFTAEEEIGMSELRTALVDSGDADLAASLDLLRLGATAAAQAAQQQELALASLDEDLRQWAERETFLKNRGFWRGVRDGGLVLFTTSIATSLLVAVVIDRNEGLLRNGFYTDWSSKSDFMEGLEWTLLGSATTAFFSLFPLLWGEARQ